MFGDGAKKCSVLPERDENNTSADVLLWDANNQRWCRGFYRFEPRGVASAGWDSFDEWESPEFTHWLLYPPPPEKP